MTEVNFTVTDVFDIQTRDGLLVAGQLVSGEITAGDVLRNATTGKPVTVLGVEFHSSREPGRFTLIIDRRDHAHIQVGQHLEGPR
ncbi:hypothetical protein [Nocardia arthritidis]|uniref:Translation elongation factor EFTu-like domain-containing protein n=1 Tax=Nocardia arthritidis TaxID=228602 RepID=A0A6G9Y4C3_9NOCA|nr:hypothetical protein [Nocardia arthritidis]QIS07947.1 hypothetical protein F5544_00055 [Nocardia arthritidis]